MDRADEYRLRKNRTKILKDVRLQDVKDQLFEAGTLTAVDIEECESKATPTAQMGALLDMLPRRGPDAYNNFCSAVQRDYSWIVTSLNETPIQLNENECVMRERIREPYKDLNHQVFRIVTGSSALLKRHRYIMRGLGLPEVEMDQIEYAHPRDLREQFYQCLTKWQSMEGKSATVEKLTKILREEECREVADKLDGYTV